MPWSRRAAAVVFFLAAGMSQWAGPPVMGAQSDRTPVTAADVNRWMTDLSNWGRWGPDDQVGALNLITPEKRRQAAALARLGTVVSLERPVALVPKPAETRADGKPHGITTVTEAAGCTKLGLDLSIVPWLKARDVAVTSGVRAIPDDRHADHRLTLVALGVFLLDGVDLTRLAETSAALNRWEFMLVVAPPQVPGRTGAIVNPLAIF